MVLPSCILFFSMLNGIDPAVTHAIIEVESGGNTMAISKDGYDLGLMQIRKKYSKYTETQLFNACTNVMAATEILYKAKEYCKNCKDIEYVNLYNLGHSGGNKIKYHNKFKYYKKIIAKIRENN